CLVFLGFRNHGWKYYQHFTGPIPLMAPFMIVLELISNFARLISLSMRLFGNIMAKEILLTVLFMLAGAFFAPLPILALGVLVSLIQAVVFVLLAVIYCAGAMEHAH
ncbi:MAG: F0F1 ATP synthase subunit A, partial [Candidatus Electrothrix sp. ATG2]|nr:F0F1 ATP synthase subunit A [Candidatus Electrothrix sp. ATG2]